MSSEIPEPGTPQGAAGPPAGRGTPAAPGPVGDDATRSESSASAPPPPSIIVRGYTLVREISRGGQAVIFQAVQESTGRKVAVRMMREGRLMAADQRARFEREVQILAALQHPNIVTIIDRGQTDDGSPFIVMDYIEGVPLDEYLKAYYQKHHGQHPDPREMLHLFMKVTDAVNAAHLRGIVHRDLKPSNIRIDGRDEPHILDFGLARTAVQALTDGGTPQPVTMTGQFLGSLPWASPEQAEGRPGKIDIRSDVYSLGVILYQMLTGGHFPYDVGGTMRDVLNNIITVEPTPPSKILLAKDAARQVRRRYFRRRKGLDEILEAIVMKALAKKAEDRYQSAGDLARDIANFLSGLPTIAAGAAALKRQKKTRLVRLAAVAGAVLVACGLGALITWHFMPRQSATAPALEVGPQSPAVETAAPAAANPPNTLTEAERAAGWKLLFDGKTLAGWHEWQKKGPPVGCAVEDGCIAFTARGNDLATDDEFDDFELVFEWKLPEAGNSGVFYRANESTDLTTTAPEYQILDNVGHKATWLGPKTVAASVVGVLGPSQDVTRPIGQFNESRIVCQGGRVEHWLNGVKVVDYDIDSDAWKKARSQATSSRNKEDYAAERRGHIVLQNYRLAEFRRAWFRNIKVRQIGPGAAPAAASPPNTLTEAERAAGWKLLFDGKTLAGWQQWPSGPAAPDAWAVEDGAIATVAERTQSMLATADSFGDFELTFEWKVSNKGNGGVFYRAQKGIQAPEYQVLDNDGHLDGQTSNKRAASVFSVLAPQNDVTKPVGEYNEGHIVCRGTKVEHWLNGQKVLEYDTQSDGWREAVQKAVGAIKNSPNFGQALPGHVALQNMGSKVWYRSIKIRPLEEASAPAAAESPPKVGGVDDAFIKEVAALPPEQQVARVVAKLKELNPGFDPASARHKVEDDQVTELRLSACGVGCINRKKAFENETTVKSMKFENKRPYRVALKVMLQDDKVSMDVTLDGQPLLAWQGPRSALSENTDWHFPQPECFGLGLMNGTVEFSAARLRVLSGEAKPVAPADPDPK